MALGAVGRKPTPDTLANPRRTAAYCRDAELRNNLEAIGRYGYQCVARLYILARSLGAHRLRVTSDYNRGDSFENQHTDALLRAEQAESQTI